MSVDVQVRVEVVRYRVEENIESISCWGEGQPMEECERNQVPRTPSSIAEAVGCTLIFGSALVRRYTLPDILGLFDADLGLVSGNFLMKRVNLLIERNPGSDS